VLRSPRLAGASGFRPTRKALAPACDSRAISAGVKIPLFRNDDAIRWNKLRELLGSLEVRLKAVQVAIIDPDQVGIERKARV